jgi:hypothetical protein
MLAGGLAGSLLPIVWMLCRGILDKKSLMTYAPCRAPGICRMGLHLRDP